MSLESIASTYAGRARSQAALKTDKFLVKTAQMKLTIPMTARDARAVMVEFQQAHTSISSSFPLSSPLTVAKLPRPLFWPLPPLTSSAKSSQPHLAKWKS